MTEATRELDGDLLVAQARALFSGERDAVANAANLCALIFTSFAELNWSGFYFVRGDELVLGPFQGKPACVRIGFGRGVCGAVWEHGVTLVVPDVHAFPGHIACDSASNSEIVVPLRRNHGVIGVMDVDSPIRGRFSERDRHTLESLAALYVVSSDVSESDTSG